VRRGRLSASIVAALAAAAVVAAGAWGAAVPNLPWTNVLPPAASPNVDRPVKVAGCRPATIRCIALAQRRLKALRDRLGCDHRAVFATTYMVLTRELRRAVGDDPGLFRFPKYLFREDLLFARVYFRTGRAFERGDEVAEAWRIAFETARDGEVNAGQDMLLGINAHVQNDMPFVLAALGVRGRHGSSRKPDHDAANEVLNRAYEPVVRAVARRYDPLISTTNASWNPIDDATGLEMVRGWREGVWRNAERLVNAESAAERREVATQIEAHAAEWARTIAAPQQPGYRAERDAYCESQLSK
jgi:hypothetical protein